MFLIVAAITKRAQLPFSRWLPAAIEAPTPVSALVHSSTLVTAGVYLIIRLYCFLRNRMLFNISILIIGAVTRLFAGIRAIVEFDLKKVIALSTLSQLGLIIIRIGLGYPFLALFHLITHAMFKALLFICAGCLIHFHGHAQDIRQMGGVRDHFPITTSAFCVSNFALCAVPFIAGFYSKDAILEAFFFSCFSLIVVFVAMRSTLFTRIYSTRVLIGAVISAQKSQRSSRFCEPIISPIVRLRRGAIFAGAILVSVSSPFALEPFNPFSKRFLTFLLFLGPSIVVSLSGLKRVKRLEILAYAYYAAGRSILCLTPLTSQKFLFRVNSPSRQVSLSDQSWIEKGQIEIWSRTSSQLINMLVGGGVFVVVVFAGII